MTPPAPPTITLTGTDELTIVYTARQTGITVTVHVSGLEDQLHLTHGTTRYTVYAQAETEETPLCPPPTATRSSRPC